MSGVSTAVLDSALHEWIRKLYGVVDQNLTWAYVLYELAELLDMQYLSLEIDGNLVAQAVLVNDHYDDTQVFKHTCADETRLEWHYVSRVAPGQPAQDTSSTRPSDHLSTPLSNLLSTLAPHFERTLTLQHRSAALMNTLPAICEQLTRQLGVGVLVLNHERLKVQEANQMAVDLLHNHPQVWLDQSTNRLMFEDKHVQQNMQTFMRQQALPGTATEEYTQVGQARRRLALLMLPGSRFGISAGAVLLISQAEHSLQRHTIPISHAFGLSNREKAVVQGLAAGMDLDEIAIADGVSKQTLKSQLKRVFKKVGVNTRSQLLGKILNQPTIFLSQER